ncbi:hypothetical protein CLOSTMETH_01602 [[Clostridium] methylpentosum DSM 5476]|uniref:Uncharacterized protein n=1 Tax=[Clostridium] methylpentosum DSM 5476 TaxID=537013 RepID=C0ECN1_9FIRM|nr:hypothetical protein CLOSTMETH_01602 [[Clostridium] methylpentosum DSM 5476]
MPPALHRQHALSSAESIFSEILSTFLGLLQTAGDTYFTEFMGP